MNGYTFWICIWAIIISAILSINLLGVSYYSTKNELMDKLIRDGHDPIAVVCAFDTPGSDNPMCLIHIMEEVRDGIILNMESN